MDEEGFYECSDSAVSSDSVLSSYIKNKLSNNDYNKDCNVHHSLNHLGPASITKAQQSRPTSSIKKPNNNEKCDNNCIQCKDFTEAVCHVNLASIMKLKASTRKLMYLLEEIDTKTRKKQMVHNTSSHLCDLIGSTIPPTSEIPTDTDRIGAAALKRLENQTKNLDALYIEDEEDDCSIYKRLTRKCTCFNTKEYNDLMIIFNEDTKYFTTNIGEIIKNIRILKKFLYMGGEHTKNALLFLNEGLSESSHSEKVEIVQGCTHADICNVFEKHSIAIVCISWPCKYDNCGDATTQSLAVGLLYKLAQLEEGRRYLKFSSKITNDMRKILKQKASTLEFDTLELLTATLSLMHPPISHLNVTYYCKPVDEGTGNKILNALIQYRQYMTLDEIFTHLDLLQKLSNSDYGKTDFIANLRNLLIVFKQLIMEYDNSEINIVITSILNNIVSKNISKEAEKDLPKTMVIADTATEPIKMKDVTVQIPQKRHINNNNKKSKFASSLNKFRQQSKRTVSEWGHPRHINMSKNFSKDPRNVAIIVPIE